MRRLRSQDLAGRAALVTGGSRGLGFALVRVLAHRGARVATCARDPEALDRARARLAAEGLDVLVSPCDVSDPERVRRWVTDAATTLGGIDVLVNNAGVISVGPHRALTREDFEEAMAIHFWGTFDPIVAALPHLRARGGGTIVNVTSIGGKASVPQLLSYSPSKYAAVGLSEGLRAELAPEGIHVVTVVPGLMRTGSYRAAYFKGDHRLEYALFAPISASPLNTVAAGRAARRIVRAIERRETEVTIGLHAKALARANGLAPGLTNDVLALAARLLPKADGPTDRVRGADVHSRVDRSVLTYFGRRAQRAYNQVPSP